MVFRLKFGIAYQAQLEKNNNINSPLSLIFVCAVVSQFGSNSSDQSSADSNHGVPWIAGPRGVLSRPKDMKSQWFSAGKLSTKGGFSCHLSLQEGNSTNH